MVYHKSFESEPGLTPAFSLVSSFELVASKGGMFTYSPDGGRLALSHSSGKDLLIMNDDGTDLHRVLDSGNKLVDIPAWSPDGKYIAVGIGAYFDRPAQPTQLALIQPDGSGLRMLTTGAANSGFASWSPDGKQLVFRVMGDGQRGLRVLTPETGKVSTLTNEYDTFPKWSPRGDSIVFCSLRSGDFEIYTIRPDGSGVRKLTNSHGNDAHPSWSPDGNWIMFTSSRMGFKDEAMLDELGKPQPYGELFIMRPDGTAIQQLTDNQWEDGGQAWRPKLSGRDTSPVKRHRPPEELAR